MKKTFKSDIPTLDELNPALQFISTRDEGEQEHAKFTLPDETADGFIDYFNDDEAEALTASPLPKRKEKKTAAPLHAPRAPRAKGTEEAKSRRVQLLVKPSIYESIKDHATQDGQSVNDKINSILEEYLRHGNS